MRILQSPIRRTERIRFSSEGTMLVGSGVGTTKLTPPGVTRGMAIWDLRSDDEPECVMRGKGVNDFYWLPCGEKVLVDMRAEGIARFDLNSRRSEQLLPADYLYHRRACSPDGSQLVQHGFVARFTRRRDVALIARRLGNSSRLDEVWAQPLETNWNLLNLAYVPDGNSILLAESRVVERRQTTRVQRRSSETGELTGSSIVPFDKAIDLLVSPDLTRLAVLAGHDIVCGLLDHPEAGTVTLTNDTASHFSDIAFHPTSRILAAASNDQTIKFYETDAWTLLGTFTWNSGKMRSVAFSPDGTVAAAGSSTGQVVLWDVDF